MVERVAIWVGGVLAAGGVAVLVGYGLFFFFREFFGSVHVPPSILIAVLAVIFGIVVLLVAVLAERLRRRKHENIEEAKY